MKSTIFVSLLAILLVAAPSIFASIRVTNVSNEQAVKDYAMSVQVQPVGTNHVGVRVAFVPRGRLATFSSAQLEIGSADQLLVSARLLPEVKTTNSVVLYFQTQPANVTISTLTLYYRIDKGYPPYDAVKINVRDFLASE